MSAHYAAPGLRRPQLATPPVRRKALFVAAATLCAPALAALALAALAASGGGDRAAMGSLAGTEGLRGTTTPSLSDAQSSQSLRPEARTGKDDWSDTTSSRHLRKDPPLQKSPSEPPARPPAHRAPAPQRPHVKPTPNTHVKTPTLPTYDPTAPGAPISPGTSTTTTSGTAGGSSGPGPGSNPGSNVGPAGPGEGPETYPGGA
jgi:hypothetical protein